MGNTVHVVYCEVQRVRDAYWVFGSIKTTVWSVADLWQRFSKSPVEVLERGSCVINWQQKHVSHKHRVQKHTPHNHSPENRMRPHHNGVWKVDRSEAKEREDCAKHGTALLDVKKDVVRMWLHRLCEISEEIWTSQYIQDHNQQSQTRECLRFEENRMVLFVLEFVARKDHGSYVSSVVDYCLEANWTLVAFVGDLFVLWFFFRWRHLLLNC